MSVVSHPCGQFLFLWGNYFGSVATQIAAPLLLTSFYSETNVTLKRRGSKSATCEQKAPGEWGGGVGGGIGGAVKL